MPYESDAQRRWAHTPTGTKALGGPNKVKEWDRASKGKDLPESVKPQKGRRNYAKGGIIRPPLEDPDIDERPAQARRDIEGAMQSLGTVPDPDVSGGRGIREHENWPYTEEGEEDPTPGRRS